MPTVENGASDPNPDLVDDEPATLDVMERHLADIAREREQKAAQDQQGGPAT